MIDFSTPIRITPTVQKYAWGKRGQESLVARLAGAENLDPYAELWVGAHPKSPALVSTDPEETLASLIDSNPVKILGQKSVDKFGGTLPFLFKVLSVAEPLSIQAHPNKALAKKLHSEDPEHYPDDNHKPEVAIAVTKVELLYGFRPINDYRKILELRPEAAGPIDLQDIEIALNSDEPLKKLFESFLNATDSDVKESQARLIEAINGSETKLPEDTWVLKVNNLYPEGDTGVFLLYLMNLFTLDPGEALYTEASVPHAYLSGDLLECMANSDNVVRAALTPKFKDTDTLIRMTAYQDKEPEKILPAGDNRLKTYSLPTDEFEISISHEGNLTSSTLDSAVLLFCLDGSAKVSANGSAISLATGEACLIPASCGSYSQSVSGTLVTCAVP